MAKYSLKETATGLMLVRGNAHYGEVSNFQLNESEGFKVAGVAIEIVGEPNESEIDTNISLVLKAGDVENNFTVMKGFVNKPLTPDAADAAALVEAEEVDPLLAAEEKAKQEAANAAASGAADGAKDKAKKPEVKEGEGGDDLNPATMKEKIAARKDSVALKSLSGVIADRRRGAFTKKQPLAQVIRRRLAGMS